MTIIVGITQRGIIVAEAATAETTAILSNFLRQGIEGGANAISQGTDAQSLWQTIENAFSGNLSGTAQVLGSAAFGTGVSIAVLGSGVTGAAIAAAALAAGVVLSPAAIATGVVVAGVAAGYLAGELYNDAFNKLKDAGHWLGQNLPTPYDIGQAVDDFFKAAKKFLRVDPLTLDLNDNGLETVGISSANPILFDHQGNGIKIGTGWVLPSDGFLTLDRNGNGSIDNGTELFGDSTPLYAGGKAADGFAALAQEDSNADGIVNHLDANWNNLRVWRDLNQDGISDAGELFTMEAVGIASLNVASTEHSQILANGNEIADLGTYTKTDGSSSTMGVVSQMGDINLGVDTFHSEFTDHVTITDGAAVLPNMNGSGQVRQLREAASLSGDLQGALAQYSQATTREAQLGMLDAVLAAWADTSGMEKYAQNRVPDFSGYVVKYEEFGNQKHLIPNALGGQTYDPNWLEIVAAWEQKLHILESFNGQYFFEFPDENNIGDGAIFGVTPVLDNNGTGGGGYIGGAYEIRLAQAQVDLLNQSYAALRESVYAGLIMQTRLRPLLDQIGLVIDDNGISLDFTALNADLASRIAANPAQGMSDLIEFTHYSKQMLSSAGWDGYQLIELYARSLPVTSELQAVYDTFGLMMAGQPGYTNTGTAKNEIFLAGDDNDLVFAGGGDDAVLGGGGDDHLHGGNGDDALFGGDGNDSLYGDAGNDTLDGGAGNDILRDVSGNNLYLFGKGDGQDQISYFYDITAGKLNTLQFKAGVAPSEVAVTRVGASLVLSIAGTTDKMTVEFFYYNDDPANSYNPLQQVQFTDGTTWDIATLKAMALLGNDTAQNLTGYGSDDVISAMGGDDTIYGQAGNDTIDGGAGNDYMDGGAGNDLLLGGAGNDDMNGGAGNDTLDGGTGNDILADSQGNNIYLFGRGDGQDLINRSNDPSVSKLNTLQFKADVAASEVSVTRVGASLVLSITGTTDTMTVEFFFYNDDPTSFYNPVQQVQFSDGTTWDIMTLKAMALAGDDTAQNLTGYGSDDVINAMGGDDMVYGQAGNDTLDGGAGNDHLDGGAGNDLLLGGAGNDDMNGGAGDDTLDGGAGNDTLTDSQGNNIYLFGKGDGQDLISRSNDPSVGKLNTLQFKAGVAASEVAVTRVGASLVLSIAGTTDKMTVEFFFYNDDPGSSYNPVQQVKFSDGTTWNLATLKTKALFGDDTAQVLNGTPNDDVINAMGGDDMVYGQAGNDTLDGGAGNDHLDGGAGNDLLLGGAGNDDMNGGAGNDTLDGGTGNDILADSQGNNIYLFGRGDGQDLINRSNDPSVSKLNTLQFKADVAASEVAVTRVGANLVLSISGTTDKMTVGFFFYNDDPASFYNPVQRVQFSDGTTWDIATLKAMALAGNDTAQYLTGYGSDDVINAMGGDDMVYGQAGNDTLDGGAGNDHLDGGAGNDLLLGGAGNDDMNGGAGNDTLDGGTGNDILADSQGSNIYLFGKGDGQDLINRSNDPSVSKLNTLQFKAGVAASEVSVTRAGASLVLSIAGTTDTMTVGFFFYNDDPTSSYNPVQQVKFNDGTTWNIATLKAMALAGNETAQTLTGHIGDDLIEALGGNDSVYGQAGNDMIDGGAGNDSISGGTGNDLLFGGTGVDTVTDTIGNNLLDGGAGNDILTGGTGKEFLVGGTGNDTLTTSTGADVIAFNRGDGQDIVNASTGKDNTVSLGKGIKYADLLFKKNANDLILVTGTAEQLTFKDWYANVNNRSVAKLQVVIEGTTDYNAGSGNAINNQKIVQFNFDGLATAFDQARAATPSLTSWALSPSLSAYYLSGSDTAAIGGDLAYQYAKDGHFSALSTSAMQTVLADSQFGSANQTLQVMGAMQATGFMSQSGMTPANGEPIERITITDGATVRSDTAGAGKVRIGTPTPDLDERVVLTDGHAISENAISGKFPSLNDAIRLLVAASPESAYSTYSPWDWVNNQGVGNWQEMVDRASFHNPATVGAISPAGEQQGSVEGMVRGSDQASIAAPIPTGWALSSSMLDFHLASSDMAGIGGELSMNAMTSAQLSLAGSPLRMAHQGMLTTQASQELPSKLM